jgi:hypothetical protein
VLKALAGPSARLVVPRVDIDDIYYELTHDRIAAVIKNLIEEHLREEDQHLDFDSDLIKMTGFVARRTELFLKSNDESAIELNTEQFEFILLNERTLIWNSDRENWFDAAKKSRKASKKKHLRSLFMRIGASFVALILLTFIMIIGANFLLRRAEENRLVKQVEEAEDIRLVLEGVNRLTTKYKFQNERIRELLDKRSDDAYQTILFGNPIGMSEILRSKARILVANALIEKARTLHEFGALAAVAGEVIQIDSTKVESW